MSNNQPNPAQKRRNLIIAAIKEQQGVIESLKSENASLTRAVATLAVAAGVGRHPAFAGLVRTAGLTHLADSAQNPDGAPATTTEEAAKPQATDDVNNVGAAPSEANKDVTPAAVTDVNNSNVAANPPVLDNLQDVTKPVSGTDAPTPAAGDAAGTSTVTVGTPSQTSFDSTGPQWKSSSRGEEQERFVASVRLARLQIEAGVAQGEDMALAQRIAESEASMAEINASIATLAQVKQAKAEAIPAQQERTRGLVPRAAQRQGQQGGIQPLAPSLQTQATTSSRPGEDEWTFGTDDL